MILAVQHLAAHGHCHAPLWTLALVLTIIAALAIVPALTTRREN